LLPLVMSAWSVRFHPGRLAASHWYSERTPSSSPLAPVIRKLSAALATGQLIGLSRTFASADETEASAATSAIDSSGNL
jgi:hypothetical protein